MIRVTRFHRWRTSACFDQDYYDNQHMQLTRDQLLPHGLLRLENDRQLRWRDPAAGDVIAESHAYFASLAEAQAAMAAAGAALLQDVARYTNLEPEIRLTAVTAHL
jgi:uncharacterized protein (TIGR02118 family)